MPMSYANEFHDLVKLISQLWGEPRVQVLNPVATSRDETRVSAVWFINGINHGIAVSSISYRYTIHSWRHSGDLMSCELSISRSVEAIMPYLIKAAQLVELMPKSNDL